MKLYIVGLPLEITTYRAFGTAGGAVISASNINNITESMILSAFPLKNILAFKFKNDAIKHEHELFLKIPYHHRPLFLIETIENTLIKNIINDFFEINTRDIKEIHLAQFYHSRLAKVFSFDFASYRLKYDCIWKDSDKRALESMVEMYNTVKPVSRLQKFWGNNFFSKSLESMVNHKDFSKRLLDLRNNIQPNSIEECAILNSMISYMNFKEMKKIKLTLLLPVASNNEKLKEKFSVINFPGLEFFERNQKTLSPLQEDIQDTHSKMVAYNSTS